MSMKERWDVNYEGKTKYSQTNLPSGNLDLGHDSNTESPES